MKAIFCVPIENRNFILPEEFGEGYMDILPVGHGFSAVGEIPKATTGLVLIESSEEIIETMKQDERFLWIEDI